MPTILALESSCDDTACAVIKENKIIANLQAGQQIHESFGGVVPELASREHMKHIWPLVHETMQTAAISRKDIDAIAFTRGPGLIGSLIVGVNFAKAFALALEKPIIEVNHMQAHVGAHYIDAPQPEFPFLCLTVSGGHTQLVFIKDYLNMEVIGQTLDDAAGEAFDKAAKLFGLPYPGGPNIDQFAQQGKPVYEFNKPGVGELDFSFSGLKTSILYFIQKKVKKEPDFIENNLEDLCASVQHTIVSILLEKLKAAADRTGINQIAISGGVAANSELRKRFQQLGEQEGWATYIPKFEYCTDNAAMIAVIAHHKYLVNDFAHQNIGPLPRYSF